MTNKMIAEYVWIGGEGELRSKARSLPENQDLNHLPEWNYDGSSTKQAEGNDSEVILKPRNVYHCPFRKENNILVMCDTYKPDGTPIFNNHRHHADKIFSQNLDEKPWYGIEQEFFMINRKTNKPLGFPQEGHPNPQFQYYCSVGAGNAIGRALIDEHYQACLDAGLSISGINAEVAPGQWEYQIGPVEGINAGDQVCISRYILQRIAEKYDVGIDFEPKPVAGDWNGSGCHTNYSTKSMREGTDSKTGYQVIEEAIEKLSKRHDEHMAVYGTGNELRMTGLHETSRFDQFSYGVANRGASVRIPNATIQDGKGYFEDRRPSSNMDPYQVTSILFETTVLM
jgi:glutamine synthetase